MDNRRDGDRILSVTSSSPAAATVPVAFSSSGGAPPSLSPPNRNNSISQQITAMNSGDNQSSQSSHVLSGASVSVSGGTASSATGVPSMKTKLMRVNMAEGGGKFVRLNVGGRFFQTTVDTLTNQESMFSAMMSGRMDLVADEEGWILIDRDGTYFEHILNFFRDGTLCVENLSDKELHSILTEANFYSIGVLVNLLQQTVEDRHSTHVKNFSPKEVKLVPFICTKQLDESSLFETGKAAVKFLCNRQNNKYSYTSQSDENLLKNIELFDKLAVLYQGRLNFFKDIFGFSSNEICQWTFYNKLGQKRAEVCCSSIVYSTEKKNIKIEFPEAKVQEELIFLI
ncbi:BTB/POZ domain-containing adapter for CUL3-mediated RhoA degradation protein 2-like isoform X2 [Symsagittifera roscoffensis]